MQRTPVESSNVISVGYDASSHVLEVEFKTGVYQYADVPADVAEGLLSAPSVGSYMHKHIRGVYDHSRVAA